MFKFLVAFVLVNGQMEDPVGLLESKPVWDSQEECEDAIKAIKWTDFLDDHYAGVEMKLQAQCIKTLTPKELGI